MTDSPPTADPDALGVGLLLFIHYRAMETRVFQALEDAGFSDITPAQARLLQRIGPNGTRVTELADAAQVTKQTASFLVDQLERAGYVRRTPTPLTRGRDWCFSPTARRPPDRWPTPRWPRWKQSGARTSARADGTNCAQH